MNRNSDTEEDQAAPVKQDDQLLKACLKAFPHDLRGQTMMWSTSSLVPIFWQRTEEELYTAMLHQVDQLKLSCEQLAKMMNIMKDDEATCPSAKCKESQNSSSSTVVTVQSPKEPPKQTRKRALSC